VWHILPVFFTFVSVGICRLRLKHLDFSCNRVAHIPCDIRKVETLEELSLNNNPLLSPPAAVSSCVLFDIQGDTKISFNTF